MTSTHSTDHSPNPPIPEGCRAALRLLQTTDTHGNLLSYDYHTDQAVESYGLSRVATLIRRAREQTPNCLLFDNGDFLQGTPLSDLTARPEGGWQGPHPVIEAMNTLGYDAATLGNHEFNFGLDWLMRVLADADFPLTCANALTGRGDTPADDHSLLPASLLLHRELLDTTGTPRPIAVGVFGLVPPQITTWDQYHLSDRLHARDMMETARHIIPNLRAQGADLVIALAHTGIEPEEERPGMENAALPLAAIPGVDAVLAGHTHHVFPGLRFDGMDGIDTRTGTLHGTPAVMAGFRGSHLGQIDLDLCYKDDHWQVTHARSIALPVAPSPDQGGSVPEDASFARRLATAHRATLNLTQSPLGQTDQPLHSYLSLAGRSAAIEMVTEAQRAAVLDQLDPDVPLLSASASFKTGGRSGPWHYTDVPKGPLFLRHAADLYPFPNVLCVLHITGAQLRDWLERAATVFNTITPGRTHQRLLNPLVPGHAFDVVHGATYEIDLTHPPRYIPGSAGVMPHGKGRIRDLRVDGQPVAADDRYLLATNNYRAFGGGQYPPARPEQIINTKAPQIIDLLASHMSAPAKDRHSAGPIWRFAPIADTSVVFDTGPGLRAYPDDIAGLGAQDMGNTETGFARFALPL